MHAPFSYFKKCVWYSVLNMGKSKIEGRKTRVKTDHRSLSPTVDQSGEQWVLNRSVMGALFVSILQTMYLANGSQNFFDKNGKTFGNSCKGFSKAVSRADLVQKRSFEVSNPRRQRAPPPFAGEGYWPQMTFSGPKSARLTAFEKPLHEFPKIFPVFMVMQPPWVFRE